MCRDQAFIDRAGDILLRWLAKQGRKRSARILPSGVKVKAMRTGLPS